MFIPGASDLEEKKSVSIMIEDESELASLEGYGVECGSVAFTAGYKKMWQLAEDGTWVSIV